MHLTADERLQRHPSLRNFDNWPVIRVEEIESSKRAAFRRNIKAMQLVLAQIPYNEIQGATGLNPAQISRLKKRALAGDEEEEPALTQALIPYVRLVRPKRRKALATMVEGSGAACSFQALLDTVPGLKDGLEKLLKADLADDPNAENLTPASFHQHFLVFLDKANHPQTSYPFTEDWLAYESCRLYYHRRRNELLMEKALKRQPKRIISPLSSDFYFGREIQIDECTFDAHTTIYVLWDSSLVPLRVSRFSVLIISDVDSSAYLGFYLTLNTHCSQYDVLSTMIKACQFSETEKPTVEGIHYLPGANFPNQISPEISRVAWSRVALDNAMAHHASSVADYVCDHHYATLSLGVPASPKRRSLIENAIRRVADIGSRFKSTSGKNPADPRKESKKNRKRPPVVTVQAIEEAIYAELGKANNTPKAFLMGNTPLDMVQQSMISYPLRLRPIDLVRAKSPFVLEEHVNLKWIKEDHRTPHINFLYLRYQGSFLSDLIANGEKKVVIQYDYRDIRKLDVYTLDGRYAGEVTAPKSWQRFPHSVKTRQYIHRLCRRLKIRMKAPLVDYFQLQLERANKPRSALEMFRLYKEFTNPAFKLDPSNQSTPEPHDDAIPPSKSDSTVNAKRSSDVIEKVVETPKWSTNMAYHHNEVSNG